MLGMYRVNDDDYPKIKVGEYILCRQDENKIWIQRGSEGGEFMESILEAAIQAVFDDHF